MKTKYQSTCWLVAIAAATVVPLSASAQQLEEIIVTATHRAENLQDVPVTVTAMGREQLEKADIFDATTIAFHVPGMAYAEFAPGQALISLRGIGSADDGAGLDNSVALFLDGVYIGRGASINFDMFDLDRIEVLRGPQGTLFGRNAIGGAINVITEKPSDELTTRIGATAGNEGILRYQAYVSGPVSENWAAKIVVNHREHDGFVRNLILNKDQQSEDQWHPLQCRGAGLDRHGLEPRLHRIPVGPGDLPQGDRSHPPRRADGRGGGGRGPGHLAGFRRGELCHRPGPYHRWRPHGETESALRD